LKIKSKMLFNFNLTGSGSQRILLPAGAVLDVEDKVARAFKADLDGLVESGCVEVIEAIAQTEEEKKAEKAKKLAEAKALVAEESKAKPKATAK
jgi:hypothetical protein